MTLSTGRGILINKTRKSDKNLIINVLTKNNGILSGLIPISQQHKLVFLDEFIYSIKVLPGRDLVSFDTLDLAERSFTDPVFNDRRDQYFLMAEILRVIFRDQPTDEGIFNVISEELRHFRGDFHPEFHIRFMVRLLEALGYAPDKDYSGIVFDLREARCVEALPVHGDHCEPGFPNFFGQFTEDNRNLYVFQNARERHDFLLLLIRFLEIQKGIKIPINSIEILRQLRD